MSPAGDRKAAREAAKRAAARRRRNRMLVAGGVAVAVLLAVVLLAGRGGDDTTEVTNRFGEGDGADEPAGGDDRPGGDEGRAFAYGTGACPPDERPAQRPTGFPDAPQRCIEDGIDYSAEVVTSEGTFVVDLFEDGAPGTVNNFVVLARSGWFDGDDFHRIVPGFVIQAGDPVGDPPGTGGPGYTIPDELDVTDGYPEGAVAMAKTAAPDSAGSQWFVCLDCSSLPPEYSLFGQVVEGLDVVRRINELGQADQTPSRPVAITRVEILEA